MSALPKVWIRITVEPPIDKKHRLAVGTEVEAQVIAHRRGEVSVEFLHPKTGALCRLYAHEYVEIPDPKK